MTDSAEILSTPMDDAIELGRILAVSLDLELTSQSPDYGKSDIMYWSMVGVAVGHQVKIIEADGQPTYCELQPYKELLELTDEVSRHSRRLYYGFEGDHSDQAQAANLSLQQLLEETIGSLVGPRS